MNAEFFLGANSGNGFYSLYDNFCCSDGDFLQLIKGGPGGGKSGFMRRIGAAAEDKGYDVEYILCSGDPDSLDGVYIPELKVGYADATAPHIMEPIHFAFDSNYVNLGEFCRRSVNSDIGEYFRLYKEMYACAYSYLSSAATNKKADNFELFDADTVKKIKMRVQNLVKLCIGKHASPSENSDISRRFISCISCKGKITKQRTIEKLCKQICLVDDRLGRAHIFLREAADAAIDSSQKVILCPDPLIPERLEAVLLPYIGTAFVSGSIMPYDKPWRHIRIDAMADSDVLRSRREEIKCNRKLYSSAMDMAVYYLSQAKCYHDLLENQYKPNMDFDGLNKFTSDEINRLFK